MQYRANRWCCRVVVKRLKIQGFVVGDPNMGPKYAAEHQKNVQKWIHEGTFKAQQSVTDGIDDAVDGLLGMLKGEVSRTTITNPRKAQILRTSLRTLARLYLRLRI